MMTNLSTTMQEHHEEELIKRLGELHVEIVCSNEGLEWFCRNTDTGEEGLHSFDTFKEALYFTAECYGLEYSLRLCDQQPQEPDVSDDDGLTDGEADAMTLGCYHDEPYEHDEG